MEFLLSDVSLLISFFRSSVEYHLTKRKYFNILVSISLFFVRYVL